MSKIVKSVNFDDIASLLKPAQRKYFEHVFRDLNRKISMHEFAIILRATERRVPVSHVLEDLRHAPEVFYAAQIFTPSSRSVSANPAH